MNNVCYRMDRGPHWAPGELWRVVWGAEREDFGHLIEAGGNPLPFTMSPMGFLLGFLGVGV